MPTYYAAPAKLPARRRTAGALAAFGATAAVLGLLVALFGAASSSPWLPDTPEAIAQAARCDQAASRSARDGCMREAVAHWQADARRGLRLASNH